MIPVQLRCVDCGHRWVTTDGRTLNVTPTGQHRIRCGSCALVRRRKLTSARVKAHRSRCNAHSAATTLLDSRKASQERSCWPSGAIR
jgi:hypothetical protein